jgi:tetratricopeptide (TPR) repeat protein
MRSKKAFINAIIVFVALVATPDLIHSQATSMDQFHQHVLKAEQALRSNDLPGAEHEYREMLTIDPQSSQAWTGLGIVLYGMGKEDLAIQALQSALKIDPSSNRAELFLGLSDADMRQCAQAAPILTKHFKTEPIGKLQRLTGLALLSCTSGAADPLPALETAQRLKQLYPDDADVLYESAELYTRLWNETAGDLIAKHPDSFRVHQLAGEVYEAKNNYAQAIREYSLALEQNPKLPEMHYRIGQLYLHQDSEDVDEKAMDQFRQEKAIDPDSAVTDLAMAGIEMHRHNLDKAKPLYEDAIKLDPTLVEADVGLARILLEEHQTDAAIEQLREAISHNPNDAQAHYVLMLAYRQGKNMSKAAAEMEIFSKLQTQKADNFQNKLDALLHDKSTSQEAAPK